MKSAVVLLSAGLDSTVNLLIAAKEHEIARVLTFDYGQRAARQEKQKAKEICKKYDLPHQIIELPFLAEVSKSALNQTTSPVPIGTDVQMDDPQTSAQTAKAVWVPNRNGIFLNIAAGVAEALGAEVIVPGFNKEEAQTFPDNSVEFLNATQAALKYSTQFPQVQVRCYTIDMDKKAIAAKGRELEAPFDLMWPCYFDGTEICRQCESCQRFLRAVKG